MSYVEIFKRDMGGPTSSGSEKATWNNNFFLNENFIFNPDLTIDGNDTYLVNITTDVDNVTFPINFVQEGTTKYTFKHNVDEVGSEVAVIQLEFQFDQQNLGTIFIRKRFFETTNYNTFKISLMEYGVVLYNLYVDVNGQVTNYELPQNSVQEISALPLPAGKVFDKWVVTGATQDVVANVYNPITSVHMSYNNMTVKATYKNTPTEKEENCIVRFDENNACMVTLKDGEFSLKKLGGE